jgi:hypothetical protein
MLDVATTTSSLLAAVDNLSKLAEGVVFDCTLIKTHV